MNNIVLKIIGSICIIVACGSVSLLLITGNAIFSVGVFAAMALLVILLMWD